MYLLASSLFRQQYSPDSTYGDGSPISSPYSDQDVNMMSRTASTTSVLDGAQPTVVNSQRNVAAPQNKQMEHIRLHQGMHLVAVADSSVV